MLGLRINEAMSLKLGHNSNSVYNNNNNNNNNSIRYQVKGCMGAVITYLWEWQWQLPEPHLWHRAPRLWARTGTGFD